MFVCFRWLEITRTRTGTREMYPTKAQTQPKASNSVHNPTVAVPREEIPGKAVPDDSRTGGILVVAPSHGNAGTILISAFAITKPI